MYTIITHDNPRMLIYHGYPPFRNLETCRDPDAVDGYIDSCDQGGDSPLHPHGLTIAGQNHYNSIDDDLQKELDL